MELILVRHATTQGNLERRYIGVTDIPIIPEGEELARRVSPTLPNVEHVYISPLTRCVQTADILWPDTEKTVIQGLIEMDFGPFEGKNHKELLDDELYKRWLENPQALDAVESVDAAAVRAIAAVTEIIGDAQSRSLNRVGIVSHGGLIMCLLSKIGNPEREFYGWNLNNCAGYIASVQQDPLVLNITGSVGNESASVGGAP